MCGCASFNASLSIPRCCLTLNSTARLSLDGHCLVVAEGRDDRVRGVILVHAVHADELAPHDARNAPASERPVKRHTLSSAPDAISPLVDRT